MASAVIGALRVNLGLNSAAFSDGMKNANSKMATFGKNVAKGMAVVGAATAAAAGAVSLAVRGVLNDADNMAKSARAIGVPVDELSRLRHAADLSGVSMGGLENGLKRLSANMYDASNGVGEGAKAFESLGISVINADGSLKSSTQVMAELAAKFETMPDGAEKTAIAMRLMGKSGADMIPMLNGGRDALQSMLDEADKMGIVITPEMAANAEQFNDNLTRLSGAVKGLAVQLTSALAPTLAAISDHVVSVVNGFQLLSPGTQKFIGIAAALTAGLIALAIPLAALVISFTAISAPVLAAVAAVAAITAGVVAFWPEIKKAGMAVVEFRAQIIDAFLEIPAQMMSIGADIMAGLWSGIQAGWATVKDGVTGIASGIKDSFTGFFQIRSPSRVMMDIGSHLMSGLRIGMTEGAGSVMSVAGTLGDNISSVFEGIGSGISAAISGTKSWASVAIDAVKAVAAAALQAWQPTSGIGGVFKGLLGGLLGGLPSFAGGGSTGTGARVGGLDGKGGFLAINHPKERIIDDTKSGMTGGGGGVHVTLGWSQGANGNIAPIIESVSQKSAQSAVSNAAPSIMKASVNGAVDAVANKRFTNPGYLT